jgi:hypothetical protein
MNRGQRGKLKPGDKFISDSMFVFTPEREELKKLHNKPKVFNTINLKQQIETNPINLHKKINKK